MGWIFILNDHAGDGPENVLASTDAENFKRRAKRWSGIGGFKLNEDELEALVKLVDAIIEVETSYLKNGGNFGTAQLTIIKERARKTDG